MKGSRFSPVRIAIGLASVAMTLLTIGLLVALPAQLESESGAGQLVTQLE